MRTHKTTEGKKESKGNDKERQIEKSITPHPCLQSSSIGAKHEALQDRGRELKEYSEAVLVSGHRRVAEKNRAAGRRGKKGGRYRTSINTKRVDPILQHGEERKNYKKILEPRQAKTGLAK